jgi:hypothetical protein
LSRILLKLLLDDTLFIGNTVTRGTVNNVVVDEYDVVVDDESVVDVLLLSSFLENADNASSAKLNDFLFFVVDEIDIDIF